ncbi:MAG TPA: AmmeMemoRadiSam system protein A [Armatimonadota bacterium]
MDDKQGEQSEQTRLARRAIESYVYHKHRLTLDDIESTILKEPAPCFVSLKIRGELRGCVGTLVATQGSLAEEIICNAISAATQDPRFWPVRPDEVPKLSISVDVLNPPEGVSGVAELNPSIYGVIVRRGRQVGLLLPDIPGITDAAYQVSIACQKAGLRPGDPELELSRFTVTRYH